MGKFHYSLGILNLVFDFEQIVAYGEKFDDYGKKKISFAELATIWEDNQYDVIIEPAGIYWYEMAQHWPKTKFIHLIRDPKSWEKSF